MGFYLSQKVKFSIPIIPVSGFCRSTETGVGRPTCTERTRQFGWRAGRPTRSTARELLLSGKPRLTGRSTGRELCSLFPGHGRPGPSTAGSTVRNLILAGRPGGRPTAVQAVDLALTASFWLAYKRGLSWTF